MIKLQNIIPDVVIPFGVFSLLAAAMFFIMYKLTLKLAYFI